MKCAGLLYDYRRVLVSGLRSCACSATVNMHLEALLWPYLTMAAMP